MAFEAKARHQALFGEPFLGMENAKDDIFLKGTDDLSIHIRKSFHGHLEHDYSGEYRPGNNIIKEIINISVDNVNGPFKLERVSNPPVCSPRKGRHRQRCLGKTGQKTPL